LAVILVRPACTVLTAIQVDDKEIFKVCIEYFDFLGKSLYDEWYVYWNPILTTLIRSAA
jgi:hypothetical protein